jgi:TatD DNase family protein
MIETDAPYLTPRTIRPKPKSSRNEPSYLPHIIDKVAQLYQCSIDEVIKASSENARKVFNLGEPK